MDDKKRKLVSTFFRSVHVFLFEFWMNVDMKMRLEYNIGSSHAFPIEVFLVAHKKIKLDKLNS